MARRSLPKEDFYQMKYCPAKDCDFKTFKLKKLAIHLKEKHGIEIDRSELIYNPKVYMKK